jgi:hypothetical protein
VPPGYQRQQPIKRPKLGPWLGVIDAILEVDKQRPAKQRHRAKRILAWGLMFLLRVEEQHRLIERFSEVLVPGGRLLFTSPAKPTVWIDGMTDLESVSLGAEKYRELLYAADFTVSEDYEDEGENHYFDAFKRS